MIMLVTYDLLIIYMLFTYDLHNVIYSIIYIMILYHAVIRNEDQFGIVKCRLKAFKPHLHIMNIHKSFPYQLHINIHITI